jgi:hypothetical protein
MLRTGIARRARGSFGFVTDRRVEVQISGRAPFVRLKPVE